MARVFGQSSDLSGKVGNITYMQTKYGTVAYPTRKQAKVPQRSERQMEIRTQWVNLGAIYRQFNQTLKKSFENVGKMTTYNAFLQANLGVVKVYITKQDRLNGGSVLAPYLISRGSLDSIVWTVNDQNVLVTDLSLGSLVIDENTTIGQVSRAIISNNEDWNNGDQLAYFAGVQIIDTVTQTPRARIKGYKLVLDVDSNQKLWDVVDKIGFTSVSGSTGYFLGMNTAVTNGAAAWVHSRESSTGALKVSTQFLYVDSAILDSYMDGSAFDSSVNSYGGINTMTVFLDPNTTSSGSGQTASNSEAPETNETPETSNVVAAPTFSGETQFTESTQVTMSAESGAEIRYTLDGSTPTSSSTLYSTPVTLTDTTTVNAIAIKDGVSSSVTSRTYTKTSGGDNTGGTEN